MKEPSLFLSGSVCSVEEKIFVTVTSGCNNNPLPGVTITNTGMLYMCSTDLFTKTHETALLNINAISLI